MPLSPRQIELVQQTFDQVKPIADAAAGLFYDRLFVIAPQARALFPDDLTDQRKKLMQALAFAVGSLRAPERVLPALREMGARHVAYGARDEHYPVVGEALLWTLERGLGDAFTPEVRDAWAATYGLVAATMQEGARAAQPAA